MFVIVYNVTPMRNLRPCRHLPVPPSARAAICLCRWIATSLVVPLVGLASIRVPFLFNQFRKPGKLRSPKRIAILPWSGPPPATPPMQPMPYVVQPPNCATQGPCWPGYPSRSTLPLSFSTLRVRACALPTSAATCPPPPHLWGTASTAPSR